jgi:hypothetical protein
MQDRCPFLKESQKALYLASAMPISGGLPFFSRRGVCDEEGDLPEMRNSICPS